VRKVLVSLYPQLKQVVAQSLLHPQLQRPEALALCVETLAKPLPLAMTFSSRKHG